MRVKLCGQIISSDWAKIYRMFGFEVCCPKDVRDAIENCKEGEELVFEINSPGGSVYAGFEMYSVIRSYKGRSVAEVQGIAASAASVVMAACETVMMSPVANVMIHRASTGANGNSSVMRQAKQMLDTIDESILTAYLEKADGKTDREAFTRMMRNETFLTAQQAVDCGLADEIIKAEGTSADPTKAVALTSEIGGFGALPSVEDLLRAATAAGVSAEELSTALETNYVLNNDHPESGGVQNPGAIPPTGGDDVGANTKAVPPAEGDGENNRTRSEGNMDEIQTKEQLMEKFPELAAQIRQEAAAAAAADAAKAERERIAAIDELAMPGYEKIISEAKADPTKTAGDVATAIVLAQKQSGENHLAQVKKDADNSGVNSVPAAAAPATAGTGEETLEAAAKAAVAAWSEEGGKK